MAWVLQLVSFSSTLKMEVNLPLESLQVRLYKQTPPKIADLKLGESVTPQVMSTQWHGHVRQDGRKQWASTVTSKHSSISCNNLHTTVVTTELKYRYITDNTQIHVWSPTKKWLIERGWSMVLDMHVLTLATKCYRSNATITIIITQLPFRDFSQSAKLKYDERNSTDIL